MKILYRRVRTLGGFFFLKRLRIWFFDPWRYLSNSKVVCAKWFKKFQTLEYFFYILSRITYFLVKKVEVTKDVMKITFIFNLMKWNVKFPRILDKKKKKRNFGSMQVFRNSSNFKFLTTLSYISFPRYNY